MRIHGWTFDPEAFELAYHDAAGDWMYGIPLDRRRTSAEVLDWICQIASKTWATPECVGGLVRLFIDVLHPQGSLCSMGVERGPIDPRITVPRVKRQWAAAERLGAVLGTKA